MRGRIESGQLVSLIPVEDPATIEVGDAVMVAWKGGYLLHLVLEATARLLLIGNNVGGINGWAPRTDVLGKVVKRRRLDTKSLYAFCSRPLCKGWRLRWG